MWYSETLCPKYLKERAGWSRGISPNYQGSLFPEKANAGPFKKVICPTILVRHFPKNNLCPSFAQTGLNNGSSMEWDAHCKDREDIRVHSGWWRWQEGVELKESLRKRKRDKTRKITKENPKHELSFKIMWNAHFESIFSDYYTYHGNFLGG